MADEVPSSPPPRGWNRRNRTEVSRIRPPYGTATSGRLTEIGGWRSGVALSKASTRLLFTRPLGGTLKMALRKLRLELQEHRRMRETPLSWLLRLAPMNHDHFIVPPGKTIRLKDYDPGFTSHYKNKDEASAKLRKDIRQLAQYQDVLYAQNTYALLVVLQAMDTAGKDGTIRHVMSGVNPQSTRVHSFKAPSADELGHDFLWRSMAALPERGGIGIFNRSYYEEVLVVRVHPEILDLQRLPPGAKGAGIWKHRFAEINSFEKYLVRNGVVVLKFFLNLSREEQKRRLLARINTPEKNWKFSLADVKERGYWDDYMKAFEDTFSHTSTEHAPWYIIPADNKWFTRTVVADVIVERLKSLQLSYPAVSKEHQQHLLEAKGLLEREPA